MKIEPVEQPVLDFCELLRQSLLGKRAGPDTDAPLRMDAPNELPNECRELLEDLAAIQRFVKGLAQGDLSHELPVRGRFPGYLKMLQANLRHLTWQVQQVAAGDFSQRVDFMGDFSDAFNLMTERLEASQRLQREMLAVADSLRDASGDLNRALSQEEVLDSLVTFAPRLVPGDALDVLMLQGEKLSGRLQIHRADGRQRDTEAELAQLEKTSLAIEGLPLLAEVLRTLSPLTASIETGPALPGYPAAMWARSVLALPFVVEGRPAGVVCVFSAQTGRFTAQDAERLAVFLSQAGVALSKARLVDSLAWSASTDALTGIPNRRDFFRRGEQELDRSRRYQHMFSVIMLDLDHFKQVNDRFGHPAGDQALIETAAVCVRVLRASDTVARLGGEEFAVLLPETEGYMALAIAERLRRAIAEHSLEIGEELMHLTASMGVAVWRNTNESFETILQQADSALYRSKRAGRNQVTLYIAEMAE